MPGRKEHSPGGTAVPTKDVAPVCVARAGEGTHEHVRTRPSAAGSALKDSIPLKSGNTEKCALFFVITP